MILNLTQHVATPEQIAEGVVDMDAEDRRCLADALTFDEAPIGAAMLCRAMEIMSLAVKYIPEGGGYVMLGGAPFFMPVLDAAARQFGYTPVYAFSKRESVETTMPDGSVVKRNVFRHAGFVGMED